MNLRRAFGALLCFSLGTAAAVSSAQAQEGADIWSRWWYGAYAGANINLFSGEIHDVNAQNLNVGAATGFTEGSGIGLALGGIVEYNTGGLVGFNLMLGYDNRAITFDSRNATPNATTGRQNEDLTASLAYFTVEPNIRVNLGGRFFHLMVGPRISMNVANAFNYTYLATDSANAPVTRSGEFDNVRSLVIGGGIGAGYDIPLAGPDAATQVLLTPFAEFNIGQGLIDPPTSSSNDFGLSTVRAGLAVKFGGRPIGGILGFDGDPDPSTDFTLRPPNVVTDSRRVNETFPMRNYLFFDNGSTEIPARYTELSSSDASNFREEQLLKAGAETGGADALQIRSRRQMEVYYNLLNVVGDRMRRFPAANIRLVGAGNGDAALGGKIAENTKKYLTSRFGIDSRRIDVEGRAMPIARAGSGATSGDDRKLLDAENTRVEILGPDEILRPVNIISTEEELLDNDIVFTIPSSTAVDSWSVEVEGGSGGPQIFGPWRGVTTARIGAKALMGSARDGRFSARTIRTLRDGRQLRSEPKDFRLVRADADEEQVGNRYSIIFEFDQSKTVQTYEKFLVETVVPSIPTGSTVIIHGHTDIIGEPDYNQKLSQSRSEAVQTILTRELTRAGKAVTFDTYGFGEDERRALFNNTLPEQRYYNRTVVIEVVPQQ
jgi:outer membrane protein OmpA-like peptidoglycan-associated protein